MQGKTMDFKRPLEGIGQCSSRTHRNAQKTHPFDVQAVDYCFKIKNKFREGDLAL